MARAMASCCERLRPSCACSRLLASRRHACSLHAHDFFSLHQIASLLFPYFANLMLSLELHNIIDEYDSLHSTIDHTKLATIEALHRHAPRYTILLTAQYLLHVTNFTANIQGKAVNEQSSHRLNMHLAHMGGCSATINIALSSHGRQTGCHASTTAVCRV